MSIRGRLSRVDAFLPKPSFSCPVFETLESRLLLNGTPIGLTEQGQILDGLSSFCSWAEQSLEMHSDLSHPLPLVGMSLAETLDLSDANLTDDGLAYLKDMKHLNDLAIGGDFTEKGIEHLKELKSLQFLYLYPDCATPNRAIRELKNSLPCLWIFDLKTR